MQPETPCAVPRGTIEKLQTYQALLAKWQKAINLVGPATIADSWNRHFRDSLQILPLLPDRAKTLYDMGSGAGFPGLVLAVARPDLAVVLIESDQKKCAFLGNVSHETKTPVRVLNERIEKATDSLPAPDIVSARALAALPALLDYVWPWAEKNPAMICIFSKGAQAGPEISAARTLWSFDLVQRQSLTDSEATILIITNLLKKIDGKTSPES